MDRGHESEPREIYVDAEYHRVLELVMGAMRWQSFADERVGTINIRKHAQKVTNEILRRD